MTTEAAMNTPPAKTHLEVTRAPATEDSNTSVTTNDIYANALIHLRRLFLVYNDVHSW